MKLFQKVYPLVGIMLLLCSRTFFAKGGELQILTDDEYRKAQLFTEDEALVMISNVHTGVFGKNNLFGGANGIAAVERDKISWDKMFNYLRVYVDESAGNNKKLLEAYETCRSVGHNMIDVLVGILGRLEGEGIGIKFRKMIERLKERTVDLKKVEKKLKNTRYYIEKKKGVKRVLLRLIITLEVTINKLDKDFNRTFN